MTRLLTTARLWFATFVGLIVLLWLLRHEVGMAVSGFLAILFSGG